MAVIHRTTMSPGKLDLLTDWLPTRRWFRGAEPPTLRKAGGFRLDDPAGAVGIEFLVVTDGSLAYHIPLTYRDAPLSDPRDGLIGTALHGVLGRRWIYDGARDPVLIAQILALSTGSAQPQAQSESDTPDPSVVVTGTAALPLGGEDSLTVTDGVEDTEIAVGRAVLRIHRVPELGSGGRGVVDVTAPWVGPDGESEHGVLISRLK